MAEKLLREAGVEWSNRQVYWMKVTAGLYGELL
jgi:hypothetical protein